MNQKDAHTIRDAAPNVDSSGIRLGRRPDFLRAGLNTFIIGNIMGLMGLTVAGVIGEIVKAPENVVVGFALVALGVIIASVGVIVAGGAELYEKLIIRPLSVKAKQEGGLGRG